MTKQIGHREFMNLRHKLEKKRTQREINCDACGEPYTGNEAGTFASLLREDIINLPPHEREQKWKDGEWDATWYCVSCCAEWWSCSREEVLQYL